MAIALENANKVRQKTRMYTLNPAIFYALKGFFLWWATNKGNADLQFIPYDGADAEAANGYNPSVDACTVWAIYGKKPRVAEDVFLALLDDATGAEGTTIVTSIGFLATNGTSTTLPQEEIFCFNTTGYVLAAGLNIKAYTTAAGTTDSTAGAAPSGFVIIGQ